MTLDVNNNKADGHGRLWFMISERRQAMMSLAQDGYRRG